MLRCLFLLPSGPAAIAKGGNEKPREYRREQSTNPDTEWAMHLVTQHQFIFAWLDGHLSEDDSQPSNDDSLEQLVDDHRAALEFLQVNLTFVNLKQSCLLGSNVGGSLVLLALSSWSPFPCGLAISPIIDWHSIRKWPLRLLAATDTFITTRQTPSWRNSI